MHPVLRLIVDHGILGIYDRIGYLVAPMRRQTMHHKAILIRQFHDIVVDLKALKVL